MKLLRLFHLVLLICVPLAHAQERPEMAKYGAAYAGPELLWVYVAHNKADDHAVVKLQGINHPLDGRTFWAEIRYHPGHPERISYIVRKNGAEKAIFFVNDNTGALYLPNWRGQERAEIRLVYSRDESLHVQPEHLLTDHERQSGKRE
ncbi:MAG: hypothetical protein LBO79_04120 [Zoogloeaceae bacterium]|nr:hypothetical protein [Zoogloeaceae bacterium]